MTVQYRPEIFTLVSVPFLDLSLPRLGGLLSVVPLSPVFP